MALDTTVGASTADSMVTLAEANAYLETFFEGDAGLSQWQDLETSMQEEMLRMAASFFSFLPLRGDKVYLATDTTSEQSMPFPRTIQTDTTIIPPEVRYCQAEVAFCVIFRKDNLSSVMRVFPCFYNRWGSYDGTGKKTGTRWPFIH